MAVHSHPVTQAMGEVVAVSGLRDHAAGDAIQLLTPHTRLPRFVGCGLSRKDDVEGVPVLGRRIVAEKFRAGDVRGIAMHPAAGVDEDRHPVLQAAPLGAAMGERAGGSELDEAAALCPALPHLFAEIACDLPVGDSGLQCSEGRGY